MDADGTLELQSPWYRTFSSYNSKVYVIPNFLPEALATQWKQELSRIWNNTRAIRDSVDNVPMNLEDIFLYASNNDGTYKSVNSNQKFRSMDKISARNIMARILKEQDFFAYSKWELPPSHKLVKDMEDAFSKDMRLKVMNILKDDYPNIELAPELSDLFVTLYSTSDFLSPHNDGYAGSWAFVISLMDGPSNREWDPEAFGGGLQFECPVDPHRHYHQGEWCEVLSPTFNTAVIFQTRVLGGPGPLHQVLPVSQTAEMEGFHRFGVTGWYMDVADKLSDMEARERDRMRARD